MCCLGNFVLESSDVSFFGTMSSIVTLNHCFSIPSCSIKAAFASSLYQDIFVGPAFLPYYKTMSGYFLVGDYYTWLRKYKIVPHAYSEELSYADATSKS